MRFTWQEAIGGFTREQQAAGLSVETVKVRGYQLRRIAVDLEGSPATVTGAQLVEWLAGQDWKPETRRSHRATLRAFFAWTVTAGVRQDNPAAELPKVKPAPPAPRPLPAVHYAAARLAADPRLLDMLELMGDAGLRRAEVAQVNSRDLVEDLCGWSLVVHGKGGKVRIVPLSNSMAERIRAADGYLFPGNDHGHLSPWWVGKLVSRALPDGWTGHKLRHMFATDAHRASGGDVFVVQQLLGHASPATTARYVALPDDAKRAAVTALRAHRSATRQNAQDVSLADAGRVGRGPLRHPSLIDSGHDELVS